MEKAWNRNSTAICSAEVNSLAERAPCIKKAAGVELRVFDVFERKLTDLK